MTEYIWTQIGAPGVDVTMQPGHAYAVLASVSKNFTKAQVVAKARDYGFAVSYAWEQGDPKRAADYNVDEWLASLVPDPNTSHRWMYGEGAYRGEAPWTLGGGAPWPLTIYTLGAAYEAVPAGSAPDAFPGSGGSPQPVIPSKGVPAIVYVLGAGALALWLVRRR